ncbi:lactonase family protein [Edaphobacter sp.]|uniref:lactonase family protein n=1 Tax=Edaphobacter sp. TaxID=1934404 RepID=UPI002DB8D206|nr:beta-propeller fold lactonase family protein [Edaphobacter sp.]HEU5340375.1 beta-propeller fold lactonase family protein [Edaphobacter sp.]
MPWRVAKMWARVMAVATLPFLAGCTGFFPPVNGGGGGGGSTGNYVYVANANRSSISGFSIGAGKLTKVANSPLPLGYTPVAMAVTPSNSFLYVAGPLSINVYAMNANGSLTVPTNGSTVASATVVSLDVSPDGKWLFGLDGFQQVLDVYAINTSTGGLAAVGNPQYPVTTGAWVPRMVRVSPNGALVFAALGTAGDAVFTFNSTTGVATWSQSLTFNTPTSDNALAIDSNSAYLYVARSGVGPGVAVYSIGTGGKLTPVTGSPFAAGTQTYSVVLNKAGTDVYAANRGDSTISGYAIGAGGLLTPLAGSPYKSGLQVTSLGIDSSGKYLLAAANGGTPDLTMYGFDATTPGRLDSLTSASTDTAPSNPVAVALTH